MSFIVHVKALVPDFHRALYKFEFLHHTARCAEHHKSEITYQLRAL